MNNFKSIIRENEFGLNIKWRLTDCCNYRCSYCVRKDKLESVSNKLKDQEIIESILPEITRLILESNKSTRILFLGGEVSLLNLNIILTTLFNNTKGLIKRINITSNFSNVPKYYNDIIDICTKNKCEICLTFSWHKEFISLDKFIDKYKKLNHTNFTKFEFEMVSGDNNHNDVEDFINASEELNINYVVDGDVFSTNWQNLVITTNKRGTPEYIVEKVDGETFTCNSGRELLKQCGDYNGKRIFLAGNYCTLDYNYFYVDKDKHIGWDENSHRCKISQDLKDFHLLKEPIICPRGCSLCGYLSVAQDKDELVRKVNANIK